MTNAAKKSAGGKREKLALEVLANGGYFRKALARNYFGHEKFQTRLHNANGTVVPGVAWCTLHALEGAGLVTRRETHYGSACVQEWQIAIMLERRQA